MALTAQFDDPAARLVMERFDAFASLLANAALPRWFYVLWGATRVVPLRKTASDRVDDVAEQLSPQSPAAAEDEPMQPTVDADAEQQAQVLFGEAPPLAQEGEPRGIQQMGRCRLGGGAGASLDITLRSFLGNPFALPAAQPRSRRRPAETRRLRGLLPGV